MVKDFALTSWSCHHFKIFLVIQTCCQGSENTQFTLLTQLLRWKNELGEKQIGGPRANLMWDCHSKSDPRHTAAGKQQPVTRKRLRANDRNPMSQHSWLNTLPPAPLWTCLGQLSPFLDRCNALLDWHTAVRTMTNGRWIQCSASKIKQYAFPEEIRALERGPWWERPRQGYQPLIQWVVEDLQVTGWWQIVCCVCHLSDHFWLSSQCLSTTNHSLCY